MCLGITSYEAERLAWLEPSQPKPQLDHQLGAAHLVGRPSYEPGLALDRSVSSSGGAACSLAAEVSSAAEQQNEQGGVELIPPEAIGMLLNA